MIKAALRTFHSPDADLDTFLPRDASNFGVVVQALIGPEDNTGEESFEFIFCTPSWLSDQVERKRVVTGRHHIFVSHYSLEMIDQTIRTLCTRAVGPDWLTVASYLARYGRWEFEDYTEAESESH